MNIQLEICAFSAESCINAEQAGADRVELCASPKEGGTTPPVALIMQARKLLVNTALFVMIRPRGGDFLYDSLELEQMEHDAVEAVKSGADGIAIGILKKDGSIDIDKCRNIIGIASKEYARIHSPGRSSDKTETDNMLNINSHKFRSRLGITFHRAFDRADVFADPSGEKLSKEKLEKRIVEVIETGADRVLTSGFMQTAADGSENIRSIVEVLRNIYLQKIGCKDIVQQQIEVMAGSGVNAENAGKLIMCGVNALHLTAKNYRQGGMIYNSPFFHDNDENELLYADSRKIAKVIKAINNHIHDN